MYIQLTPCVWDKEKQRDGLFVCTKGKLNMAPPPSEIPGRDDGDGRLEKDVSNAQVDRIVLTNCYFKCTNCKGIYPGDKFGLRYLVETHEVRNQPRCTNCRRY